MDNWTYYRELNLALSEESLTVHLVSLILLSADAVRPTLL